VDILHLAAPCRNVPVTSTLDGMATGVAKNEPTEEGASAFVIGIGGPIGTLLRFLRWFALPVVVVGARGMYRVMIQGEGFVLPIQNTGESVVGFYTTRFVSASSRLEAEAKAKLHVIREWQGLSLMSHFTGTEEPCLTVAESSFIDGRFRRNQGQGFSFYGADLD